MACSVHSLAPAAVVTWHVGSSGGSISSRSRLEPQADGWVSTRSSVRFPSSSFSGQNLSCTVEHRSLKAPERRAMLVERSRFLALSGSPHQLAWLPHHLLPSFFSQEPT